MSLAAAISALAVSAALSMAPSLSPSGWGPLKIGMKVADAVRRFHLIEPEPGFYEDGCRELSVPGHPELAVMIENGRVTRISLFRKSALRTDRSFGPGATEKTIRRAYGARLRIEPHAYEEEPARYLTWYEPSGKLGVRYETNDKRRVTAIHVGGPSIEYIEGCS